MPSSAKWAGEDHSCLQAALNETTNATLIATGFRGRAPSLLPTTHQKRAGPLLKSPGLLLRNAAPHSPLCPPRTHRGDAASVRRRQLAGQRPERLSTPAPAAASRRPAPTPSCGPQRLRASESVKPAVNGVLPALTRGHSRVRGRLRGRPDQLPRPPRRPYGLSPPPLRLPGASSARSCICRIPIKHLGEISAVYK